MNIRSLPMSSYLDYLLFFPWNRASRWILRGGLSSPPTKVSPLSLKLDLFLLDTIPDHVDFRPALE